MGWSTKKLNSEGSSAIAPPDASVLKVDTSILVYCITAPEYVE